MKNISLLNTNQHINELETSLTVPVKDKVKKLEIRFAATIAMHAAFLTADHFGELLISASCNSPNCNSALKDFKCHRTKCSAIIENVISKTISDDLIQELKGKTYSLLIDEWSDISIVPHIAVVITFFSENSKSFVSRLLALRDLDSVNSEGIFNTMMAILSDYNLDLKNCVGFGSDGANVVSGQHNSVWTRVKNESPHAVQFTCVCHSLAKVVEHSFNELPSHCAHLLSAIPKFFSKSNIRRNDFLELCNAFGSDQLSKTNPFQKYSATRWLCRGKVASKILQNWDMLKLYFEKIVSESKLEVKFKAQVILEILKNEDFKQIFKFVTPIIGTFEELNQKFQSDMMDPLVALQDLQHLKQTVHSRIYSVDGSFKPDFDIDFGFSFNFNQASAYCIEK